ncbi:retron St85 family RNA-directed DNA polymerase [Massilia sp. CMS3.1]|uniref:retron St85 family RNA-directed DNA polymerase n=1 Tax=Massilia sp. CMS3.1 TaxID=3373083 RepID=UPI003EE4708D
MNSVLLKQLNAATGLHPYILERLFYRSPYTYKVYPIPKRTGGFRTIAQPARETKLVQNWLLDNVYSKLPIHPCATAYRSGASIKNNASIHKESNYLVKLDFRNFFPSIKRVDLIHLLSAHLSEKYEENDIARIATISSFQPKDLSPLCLSIGAPSSPLLANAVMFEFDNLVEEWCRENSIDYSRYADDLAFSTNAKGMSPKIEGFVKESLLKISYPRLELNANKTTFLSKKHRRRVTGLILNNEGNVSLGRSRKREISSLINSFSHKSLSEEESSRLQGLLAFARDVEPLFVLSMNKKYGNDVLEKIFRFRKNNDISLATFFEKLSKVA